MKYKIIHRTHYYYNELVSICHNLACLTPATNKLQLCEKFQLNITPQPFDIQNRKDFFGNDVVYFSIQEPHNQLVVEAHSVIKKHIDKNLSLPLESSFTVDATKQFLKELNHKTIDIKQFTLASPFVKLQKYIFEYASISFDGNRKLFDACKDLNQRIFQDFKFVSGFTTISTPIEEVFRTKKGVCQDFSHLAIACIRSMGLAAKYVSGYIETLPPPGKTKLLGSDASHAWFSVYIPDMGWVDFDPTNNLIPGDKHVTVAYGRDYSDISPLKGVLFSGGHQRMYVSVDMEAMQ